MQTLAEADQCVTWYSWRWRIERLHFVLKSGCSYEKLQRETTERLWRALTIHLIVAWRMLLTGEVYRALKPNAVTRKYRTLHRLAQETSPLAAIAVATVPHAHLTYTRHRHLRTSVPA